MLFFTPFLRSDWNIVSEHLWGGCVCSLCMEREWKIKTRVITFSPNSRIYFSLQIVSVCRRKIAGTQITHGSSLKVSRALFPFTSTRNRMTALIGVGVGADSGGRQTTLGRAMRGSWLEARNQFLLSLKKQWVKSVRLPLDPMAGNEI